jgi:hypothetical protein
MLTTITTVSSAGSPASVDHVRYSISQTYARIREEGHLTALFFAAGFGFSQLLGWIQSMAVI